VEVYPLDPTFRLLDTLILLSLSMESRHGYDIEAHISNLGGRRVLPGTSSAYKALARLVREGHVMRLQTEAGSRRRYYAITDEGRAQLRRDLLLMRNVIAAYDTRQA
jgi:DNA-binding PadR family transcriptional regulator